MEIIETFIEGKLSIEECEDAYLMTDDSAYHLAKEIQTIMKEANFSNKLAFLPLDSIHMTIFTLLRDRDRKTDIWPDDIYCNASFTEIDQHLYEEWEKVPSFDEVTMAIDYVDSTGLRLIPASEADRKVLNHYRDALAKATGVRHPNHDDYHYHITLAYLVRDLNNEDREEVQHVCKFLTDRAKSQSMIIKAPKPVFTIFNDMLAYSTDLSDRI